MPVIATERILRGSATSSARETPGSAAASSAGREVISDQMSPLIQGCPGPSLGPLTLASREGSGLPGFDAGGAIGSYAGDGAAMAQKKNPLNLNALQLKTLTLL